MKVEESWMDSAQNGQKNGFGNEVTSASTVGLKETLTCLSGQLILLFN